MSTASKAKHAGTVPRPWTARRSPLDHTPERVRTRRYDITWLEEDGTSASYARIAPALPLFESAFSAFSRGVLIQTTEGQVAIEDMTPGMMVETETGPAQLVWMGAITLVPDSLDHAVGQKMYRVPADALGLDRPMPDLVLGPAARVLTRTPAVQRLSGADAALVPIHAFADGTAVIEVSPVSPVRVFHLGFRGHRVLRANGVELESFHPGRLSLGQLGPEMASAFMSLFPHVRDMNGFGRLSVPRLNDDDLDQVALG